MLLRLSSCLAYCIGASTQQLSLANCKSLLKCIEHLTCCCDLRPVVLRTTSCLMRLHDEPPPGASVLRPLARGTMNEQMFDTTAEFHVHPPDAGRWWSTSSVNGSWRLPITLVVPNHNTKTHLLFPTVLRVYPSVTHVVSDHSIKSSPNHITNPVIHLSLC